MLSIVVAMASNRVIGRENALPWHIPQDLKRFRSITWGKPIVMGRKTFESIGKPLEGRKNIVLSAQKIHIPNVHVVQNLTQVWQAYQTAPEIVVIGGQTLYEQTLPLCQKIYLTKLHESTHGDAYFPCIKNDQWALLSQAFCDDKKHPHHFLCLHRKRPHPSC